MFKATHQKITASIVLSLALGFVPGLFGIAHAADLGWDSDLGGGSDYGGYSLGGGSDYGGYSLGGGSDYGGYSLGGGSDLGGTTISGTTISGTPVYYENGVGYYYEDYGSSYGSSYNAPSYTPSYNYSTPSFAFSAPATYYSQPAIYSAPRPVQQQQQQQQIAAAAQPINIVNNNNNTNTNVVTGGGSAPATTTVVPISTIQYPVQYVYPNYQYPTYYNYPTYYQQYQQNIYCYISASQTSVAAGQSVYLSWSAPGATSAYLTSVGSVNPNGSITVTPSVSTTYTLTVNGGYNYNNYGYNYGYNNNYGYGGSNTCSTFVSVSQPIVYNTPSVSLSQIPYTGFDLGVLGDTMYWLALLAFALAGAYLMVYYRGGALALATAMVSRKVQAPVQMVEAAAKHIEQKVVEPVRATLENLPVFEKQTTSDTMTRVASKGSDAPRIVITRT
jgi:hypothetical protein